MKDYLVHAQMVKRFRRNTAIVLHIKGLFSNLCSICLAVIYVSFKFQSILEAVVNSDREVHKTINWSQQQNPQTQKIKFKNKTKKSENTKQKTKPRNTKQSKKQNKNS